MDKHTKKIYVGYENLEDGRPSNIGWLDEEHYNQYCKSVPKDPAHFSGQITVGLPEPENTIIYISTLTKHLNAEGDMARNITDEVTDWLIVRGAIPPEMRNYGRKPRGNEWFTPAGSDAPQ